MVILSTSDNSSIKDKMKVFYSTIILAISLYCFVSIFITPGYGDELKYHFPQAQNVSVNQIVSPASNYSSAYGPLPYMVGNIALKIYPSLISLRLLNYFIFMFSILYFYRLAKKLSKDPLLLTLLYFLNPFFLKASYTYFVNNWGFLFVFVAFDLYLSKKDFNYFIGDIFLMLSVLCQQWMLLAVIVLLLVQLELYLHGKITTIVLLKNSFQKVFIFLPALLLFYLWGGLVHPNFSSHSLYPTFEHLNAVLANIGFLTLFLVLANFKKIIQQKTILLLFPLPLFWFAIPQHSMSHGAHEITGIVSNLLLKIQTIFHLPYNFTIFILLIFGYLFFLLLVRKKGGEADRIIQFFLVGILIIFVLSSRLASSHIFLSLPLILLLFNFEIEQMKTTKVFLISQYFLVSCSYIIYITFFRSKGVLF